MGEVESLELQLLLEAVYRVSGYDFREYAPASLRRRIAGFVRAEGLHSLPALQERLLYEPGMMERFLFALSVTVTSMFRDPDFFLALRTAVIPLLRTYPFLRIWHAGCSTGEEVYSLAILLQEEGLYPRCRIYATDLNHSALKTAREGIFSLRLMPKYAENYLQAGGAGRLEDYYTSGYGNAIFKSSLRENVLFSQHNLATDRAFNEFNLILCRNVMIYFGKPLQQRVHRLLFDSLAMFGLLGLGSQETLQFTPNERCYAQLEPEWKLYRRVALPERHPPGAGVGS